jgi:hypothetical protein
MKTYQNAQLRRCIQAKHKAAHPSSNSRLSTNVGVAQAHIATDQKKAVRGGATQGAATPPPTPTAFHHHVSLPSGSSMTVAWVHARKATPNRPLHSYK